VLVAGAFGWTGALATAYWAALTLAGASLLSGYVRARKQLAAAGACDGGRLLRDDRRRTSSCLGGLGRRRYSLARPRTAQKWSRDHDRDPARMFVVTQCRTGSAKNQLDRASLSSSPGVSLAKMVLVSSLLVYHSTVCWLEIISCISCYQPMVADCC